ncbi:MAG: magnesium/cobalt transporter CorA [Bacteroidetes bacterium]|nr:magnesium/cobalt transporter CorA [Bacteroidota bacterium]MCB0842476.1 magnesium/cobalt transporter CorA [Bacteroidota bacterium]
MSESFHSMSHKAGLPPGTLMHIGKRKAEQVKISVIDYDETNYEEKICQTPKECFSYKNTKTASWINVDGLHDVDHIADIGELFSLHPLLLEDVLNTRSRPKIEEFDGYLFMSLKMLGLNKARTGIIAEQVSFVLGSGWLISFQEQEGDIFGGLRQRLKEGKGPLRQKGIDYLLYRLIDTVVDHYFWVIEYISEVSTSLEEQVLAHPDNDSLKRIQRLKKQLINLRRSVYPLREAVSLLQKEDSELISEDTNRFLRDVYEHIIQINDSIEMQRDVAASIMDLYLSGMSNKMNQVMQVLTIISTIFIPMTFIAGVYGMNFDHMPETHWKYGYFGVWGLMGVMGVTLLIYFRRKGWL